MYIKNQLKSVILVLPLILIAGLFVFASFETRSTSDSGLNDQDMSCLLSCGYIRRNIVNTIFHPNFVLYLSGQQKKFNTLNESHVKKAISIWNNNVVNKREMILYQQEHFNKLAMLSKTVDECDDNYGCVVNGEDLAVLRYWMSDIVAEVVETAAMQIINPSELKLLNIENDKNIGKALEIIMGDPVGQQLISHAIGRNITIRPENLRDHKGYFEYASKTIVIDPTVASYILKINGIVHELVHAISVDNDNSVFEETFAEMIGMAVQDRITDIDISCNPYIVFIDRLLDPHYGKYPVRNNIEKHLQQAGIVIKIASEEMD
ncbi:MAG: hypothetical protein KAT25_09490 [Sulfuriflexus sp.]|nr:hypothetical protein [Sulfuriflexus sp.]